MDQRGLGQRVGQLVEELAAVARGRVSDLRRDASHLVAAVEQAVHRSRDVDERAQPAVDGDALGLARRQQVVQIVAQPLDLSNVRPTGAGPDQRADEQHDDEHREQHDRIGEQLRHAPPLAAAPFNGRPLPHERRRAVNGDGNRSTDSDVPADT